MIVEQIWTGSLFRNFNYLIACDQTGEALAIDPLDHRKCLAVARRRGWEITRIVNTHHHIDHIAGNKRLVAATGARVLAHSGAAKRIRGVDQGLNEGDIIRVGRSVELMVMDTPGHTLSHVCLVTLTDPPALFSGDTLFNAGAGNCHQGGDPHALYRTFSNRLAGLDERTLIYPGHDYLRRNLLFTLSVEPDNAVAAELLEGEQKKDSGFVATLGMEKDINAFFRLEQQSIHAQLRQFDPAMPEDPDPEQVFVCLRQRRNRWSVPWSEKLRAVRSRF